MTDDMLTQCSERWPGLRWDYENAHAAGRAACGGLLATVVADRAGAQACFVAAVYVNGAAIRARSAVAGDALTEAMVIALERSMGLLPSSPPDTSTDWNDAIDAAVKEARHQRGASEMVGEMYTRQGFDGLADRRKSAAFALDYLADTIEAMKRPEGGSRG